MDKDSLKLRDPSDAIRHALANKDIDDSERKDLLNQALIYARELRELYAKEKARSDHLEAALEKMHAATRQQLYERQTKFATVAAHELRTPLTPLSGFLGLLWQMEESGSVDIALRREYLDICLRQVGRLSRLVEDLTVAAKPNVDPEVRPETLLVAVLFRDLVAGLRESDRQRLRLEVPETLEVFADPLSLLQVLRNVTVNALQYSEKECPVFLKASAVKENQTEITVVDEGPGIPPENLPTLFQRFDERASDVTGGMGVGLWLSQRLTNAMGGTMSVENNPKGGTIVKVQLPQKAAV